MSAGKRAARSLLVFGHTKLNPEVTTDLRGPRELLVFRQLIPVRWYRHIDALRAGLRTFHVPIFSRRCDAKTSLTSDQEVSNQVPRVQSLTGESPINLQHRSHRGFELPVGG